MGDEPRLTVTETADPGGGVLLVVSGSLDYFSAREFVAEVHRAFAGEAPVVTADLSAIQYCDSSGLAALVRAHKDALQADRRFTIRDPELNLRRILAITCLDGVLDITYTSPD